MRKNNRKRIISTVIVGAMLCAGAAFGTVKYMNRDTVSLYDGLPEGECPEGKGDSCR